MENFLLNNFRRLDSLTPSLSSIDEDYGQLETTEDTYPVTFPCVLVGNSEIDWQNLGNSGAQHGRIALAT